jgi:hypothetical protein
LLDGLLAPESIDSAVPSGDRFPEALDGRQRWRDTRQGTRGCREGPSHTGQGTRDTRQGTRSARQGTSGTRQGTRDTRQGTRGTRQGTRSGAGRSRATVDTLHDRRHHQALEQVDGLTRA